MIWWAREDLNVQPNRRWGFVGDGPRVYRIVSGTGKATIAPSASTGLRSNEGPASAMPAFGKRQRRSCRLLKGSLSEKTDSDRKDVKPFYSLRERSRGAVPDTIGGRRYSHRPRVKTLISISSASL